MAADGAAFALRGRKGGEDRGFSQAVIGEDIRFKGQFGPLYLVIFPKKTVKPSPFEVTGWRLIICEVMVGVMDGDDGDGFRAFLPQILSYALCFSRYFMCLSNESNSPFCSTFAPNPFPVISDTASRNHFSHQWENSIHPIETTFPTGGKTPLT